MKTIQRDIHQGRWCSSISSMLSIAVVITLAACSGPIKNTSTLHDNSVPNPRPADSTTVDSQLQRFVGQTEFMNVEAQYRNFFGRPDFADTRSVKATEGQRDIQESDIFKVGKEGSKLLYVLNDYRGLQVISFAKGAESPELVGRSAATGNYSTNMYFDQANDRLIVLERNWFDQESGQYRSSESRLVIYDVKDATNPTIQSTIKIGGEIADSRLVGDILYVATSVWPSWNSRNSDNKGKGQVYSYRLATDGVTEVAKHALTLPVSRRENMNIVEVESNGSYNYYLVAVLSDRGWGWWDRQSAVEVVDISSVDGKINPIMIASAKGAIEERSATSIKNNTLIVASNYRTEAASGAQSLMRVAVETFKFPTKTSTVISEDEANYRRLHIDRAMQRIPDGMDHDEYLKKLVNDSELGIAGVFVKSSAASLKKILADSTVTVGDSTGLHADLQDVRFAKDLLYIFWVPANMRDPLDIIDISKPEEGITHLKRELFEGWIERAFPVEHNGHTYIIGLGWVIPTIDNENPRRVPQVMLFEVERRGAGLRIQTVSQMNMLGSNVWVDFNAQDKFIETRFNADGTGAILFKISSWNDKYVSGGKLIGFDLNQVEAGHDDKVFVEGGLLNGSSEWLKRVFTNPEIDRVNTLTNKSLGVFNVNWKNLGAATEIHNAVATLELARDIKAYGTIKTPSGQVGVQFISDGNQWDWNASSSTHLRLVDSKKADQELSAAKSAIELPGRYLTHLIDGDSIIVVSSEMKETTSDDNNARSYKTIYHVNSVSADLHALKVTGSTSFTETARPQFGRRMWRPSYDSTAALTKLANGKTILTTYASVKDVSIASNSLSVTEMNLGDSCNRAEGVNWAVESFNGQLFMSYRVNIAHPDTLKSELNLSKNYVAKITEGTASLTCSPAINVPGKVLAIGSGKQIVTEDLRLLDLKEFRSEYRDHNGNLVVNNYFEPITAKVLTSLEVNGTLDGSTASLRDMYDLQNSTSTIHAIAGNSFVTAEKQGEYGYAMLTTISIDDANQFNKRTFGLDLQDDRSSARIVTVVQDPKTANGYLAIVAQGRRAQVLTWSTENLKPTVRQVQMVGSNLVLEKPADSFIMMNSWGWWGHDAQTNVHFSADQSSFEIPEGLSGLKQIYVGM